AYFFNPLANHMEKAGLSRVLATLTIIIGFFAAIFLLSILVVPAVSHQLAGLIAALPDYIAGFEQKCAPEINRWLGGLPIGDVQGIQSAAANVSGDMVKLAGSFVTSVLLSGVALAHLLMLMLITPVVAFYLLRDWHRITARLDLLLPRRDAPVIRRQLSIIDRTLAGFLRGQLLVCLILASYYAIGLSLTGLKFGMVIGLMTGLLVIFPYVGLLLGMATGLAVALFQFGTMTPVGGMLAVFLFGSLMESYIVTPKLVGERVGLHPLWIIFGMLSGAALFGLVGVLLAVPATAVIGVLTRFALERYVHSSYYQSKS
ncbi:MAG: AI-2E family transporter, partial [Pseudomonadota bacterium]|nr:AI-2E family transporter [Pseudomonadota bacterium]